MSSPSIVVMCTANRCRSPIGEVLLRRAFDEHGVSMEVSSAGVLEGGWRAESEAIEAVAEVGLDLSSHVSRKIDDAIIAEASLVLTMERAHVREVAVRHREALEKTFTLKDFVRRALATPPRTGGSLDAWIAELAAHRDRSTLMGSAPHDEVSDPIGKPLAAFVKTRVELEELMLHVADTVSVTQPHETPSPTGRHFR